MRTSKTFSGLLAALSMLAATGAQATPAVPGLDTASRSAMLSRLNEGRKTLPPFAFSRFCVTSPKDCARAAPSELDWTRENKSLVERVNRSVNRSITPRNDPDENWDADVAAGDCEDFALTKRRALLARGVPASALSMAIARTAQGEGHAVLVVRTSEGDLVLDNRTDRLVAWHRTDLQWIKVSSAEDPRIWRVLD